MPEKSAAVRNQYYLTFFEPLLYFEHNCIIMKMMKRDIIKGVNKVTYQLMVTIAIQKATSDGKESR